VKELLKELQDSKIDASLLVELRANHCQQAELSTMGGISA
jgi:hypothetical protein